MFKPSKISSFLLVFLVLLLSIALVACSGGGSSSSTKPDTDTPSGQSEAPKEKIFLNIATSTTGGTFYPVGGKLADMISKNIPNAQATAEATKGGVENVRLLNSKEASIALMPGDTLFNAVQGIAEFETEGKHDITQLSALFATPLQIVTLESTGIKTITDLKGKKVSIGAPGSSTAVRAEIVLNAHGLTVDDIKVDHTTSGEAANQMLDGQIDAAFFASGAPMAAIMDIAAKKEIRMLSLDPDIASKIEEEHPYLFMQMLPVDVYPGVKQEVLCVANESMLVCHPDLSEDLIYEITKMIFTDRAEFVTAHKVLEKDFKLENAMSQEKLAPFHPGALKYYKEVGLVK